MIDAFGSPLDFSPEAESAAALVMQQGGELAEYFLSAQSASEVIQRIQEKANEVNAFLKQKDVVPPPGLQGALNKAAVAMYLKKRREGGEANG